MTEKTRIAVNIFNKYAQQYQSKFMDVSLYADGFDFLCERLQTQGAHILEIACGPGNISKYLLTKRPDFNWLGIDLAPNMIALAKENNPTAEFRIMDAKAIGSLATKYEAVLCGFCLPYLSKEETNVFISDAANLITSDGLLYISTMEDDYEKSGFKKGSAGDEIFMHFHQGETLKQELIEKGFRILSEQRKIYSTGNGAQTTDLILIAQKV